MARRGIIAQAGPLMLGRGGAMVLGFVLPLVLTRLLPQAEFGTYKQVWLVVTTAYFMLQLGMTASLYYFLPKRDGNGAAYFTHTLLGVVAMGAVGAVAAYLGRNEVAHWFNNPELATFAVPMSLVVLTMTASAPIEAELLASGEVKLSAVVNFASEALRVCASVVPLLLGFGLRGFFWAYVVHNVVRCVYAWMLLRRRGGPRFDWTLFRSQLAYTLPFGAAILLDTPQKTFHQWAVGWSVDAAAFAIYAQGCFQLPIVNLLYAPVCDILQVRLAEPEGREQGIHLFHDANLRLAAALLPFTALMVAAAPLFIPALFTHRYDASVPIFRIAMLATPFAALPLEAVLRATGQTRFVFQAFFWKLVVTVPAVLLGIRFAGMEGAIAGQVLAEVTIRYVMLARVRHTLDCGYRDVLPWGELLELTVASAIACVPVVFISRSAHAGPRPFLALCAAGAAYSVVYLAALALKPGDGTPVAKVKRVLLGAPA
jgi:O-antigen/teichoic acid export membrane protein